MKNKIKILNIDINGNRIDYKYKITGEWRKYFNLQDSLYIEYSDKVEGVPNGIAIIPLLCNILPIAWIFNGIIEVDDIDEDFYLSIPEFKNGYINMYPKLQFNGSINANKIIKYEQNLSKKTISLFSGGVDAFYTFLSHIDEKPCISTVWGADIKLDDTEGWNKVLNHTLETSKLYEVDNSWIKSNFRTFIDEDKLSNAVYSKVNDGWWHGFQHGIGLIGHIAPLAYKNNISRIYIAASFTINEKGKVTCASDPTIDNYLKFCGCSVEHDGYEVGRQDKIELICRYSKINDIEIPLRVCWESKGGSNCCKCEKCYRTLFGILAEKEDPRKYGFNYSDEEFKQISIDFKERIFINISNFIYYDWTNIQKAFRRNYKLGEVDNTIKWFYKVKIYNDEEKIKKIFFRIRIKLKRKFFNILKGVRDSE